MKQTTSLGTRMKQKQFSYLNKRTELPLRYIGGELNSIVKDHSHATMLLAFPDIYEIGMSNFGSRILYEKVNYHSPYAMERVYMPWTDVYDSLKKTNTKLCSLESGKCFSEFDAVGFSLQHELCFTNVLAMLSLGGIELFAEERKSGPIIVGGGGATFNPAPISKFIDVFAIGDGEELILEIMNVLAATKDRKERLLHLSKIEGLYVPSIHGKHKVINRRLLRDLNSSPIIEHPMVPYMQLVHDRIAYELQRGCNRGCRFCQAGVIYRPVRQKDPNFILNNIDKDLKVTGYREVGFLSLNACDYPPLHSMVEKLQKHFHGRGVYISLPSLRIESISDSFMNILSQLPKSGFTIAPEAGSKRLRACINKNITDEEILNTVAIASELGWSSIKAYFMLGLPTETDQDIDELIELVFSMNRAIKNKKTKLVASFSNFVPKSHTPFQWERQISSEEFEKKLSRLRTDIRDKRISLKWNDPKMSEVEGLLSRGDERLSDVLYAVHKKGEIFTAWGGSFDYSKWAEAVQECGLTFEDYLRSRDLNEELPWSNINSGVSTDWLKTEREHAYSLTPTSYCMSGECSQCGVCSFYGASNDIASDSIPANKDLVKKEEKINLNNDKKYKIRCLYKKTGRFIWMGHFELMNAVEKALLRAEIPVSVSKGFKPTLHLSFSPPVGMGIESLAELVDIFLYEHVDANALLEKINKELPQELAFSSIKFVPLNEPSIYQSVQSVSWRAFLTGVKKEDQRIISSDTIIEIQRKEEKRIEKLSNYLAGLSFDDTKEDLIMDFEILFIDGKTLKPTEVIQALFPNVEESMVVLVRKGVVLNGVYFSN